MLYSSPYSSGDTVFIYREPQEEKEILGTARLREYRGTGLPFIISETNNEADQENFVLEDWTVEWLMVDYKLVTSTPWLFRDDRIYKIRRLHKVGI